MASQELIIPAAARLEVRFTGGPVVHPTGGYRDWRGQFEASERIVALLVAVVGTRVHWARTSHRGQSLLDVRLLLSPFRGDAHQVHVGFRIFDADVTGHVVVDGQQVCQRPLLGSFRTGELVTVATLDAQPRCELKSLFLARRDVRSARNGLWHPRTELVASIPEPWRTVLKHRRSGELEGN